MPIVIPPGGLTYTDLIADLEGYLNRTDYTTRIPRFIQLTEARLNRLLDDPEMEVILTSTTTGQYLTLPSDLGEIRSVNVGNYRLRQASAADFSGFPAIAGIPSTYGLFNGQMAFAPMPATGSAVTILYTRRIPALDLSNQTNWLLDLAYDLYLYGCLLQANVYGWFDERIPLFKAAFDEAIGELRVDGQRRRLGAAPLAPRLGRT
jgi:hypothetical protein